MRLYNLLCLFASSASAFIRPSPTAFTATIHNKKTTTPRPMVSGILDLLTGAGGPEPTMVRPEDALPGRQRKMPNISGSRHYVLGNDLETVPEGHQVAVFANGCFCTCMVTDLFGVRYSLEYLSHSVLSLSASCTIPRRSPSWTSYGGSGNLTIPRRAWDRVTIAERSTDRDSTTLTTINDD